MTREEQFEALKIWLSQFEKVQEAANTLISILETTGDALPLIPVVSTDNDPETEISLAGAELSAMWNVPHVYLHLNLKGAEFYEWFGIDTRETVAPHESYGKADVNTIVAELKPWFAHISEVIKK